MADLADSFSTLDDFLLSLADGVTQAQQELARAGAIGPPGRQFAYHLPRVEFELKMNLRVVEDPSLSARYNALRPVRAVNRHLLFKPLAAEEAATTLEIAATVRGAFVAVPANDGLPSAVLRTLVSPGPPPTVTILARNAAGEPLAGLEVQVNLDREESESLTAATGGRLYLAPGTGFREGVVTTDENGVARAVLHLDRDQRPGILALVIDAADRTETLVYEVR
jgi:hypothetical protein